MPPKCEPLTAQASTIEWQNCKIEWAAQIRIRFVRGNVRGVNGYSRHAGESDRTLFGIDSSSPLYDKRPLVHPGQAETREYMARGVVNDEEVGQDSNVVNVLYGG